MIAPADPIDLDIRRVARSDDQILRNLLEHYCHDMAEWFLLDADVDGNYHYPTDKLWELGVHVYLAYHKQIPIGFGLVGSAEAFISDADVNDLDEFFVVRRYRRSGVGQRLAVHLWDLYPGPWLVRVFQGNRPALPFWRTAIEQYTAGRYEEQVLRVGNRDWSYFRFSTDLPAGNR